MLKEKIGFGAGDVYIALIKGELSVKALKKETGLNEQNILLAIGWLAREGKIKFREEGKELFVNLL
ncbi:MAG: winged helix-turn-helix domain-containing protein [Prevotellaceae bacterium]|jgi:hypothetical protein|nr:winged helix-turn-helix domain-containing protein [Prevotellaceae bacterium]